MAQETIYKKIQQTQVKYKYTCKSLKNREVHVTLEPVNIHKNSTTTHDDCLHTTDGRRTTQDAFAKNGGVRVSHVQKPPIFAKKKPLLATTRVVTFFRGNSQGDTSHHITLPYITLRYIHYITYITLRTQIDR